MNDEEFFGGLQPYLPGEPKWLHPALPDRVIREIPVKECGNDPLKEALQLELLIEELQNFGIQTVHISDARARNKQAYMVVVDYIPGVNYSTEHTEDMSPEVVEKAHKLHENLFAYFSHKIEQGGPMLTDIEILEQYIYRDDDEDFVLVDIGTSFVDLSENSFGNLTWHLMNMGHLFGDVVRLQTAHPKDLTMWHQRANDICAILFAKNGAVVPSEKLKRLVKMFFSKKEFELDDLNQVADEIFQEHTTAHGS